MQNIAPDIWSKFGRKLWEKVSERQLENKLGNQMILVKGPKANGKSFALLFICSSLCFFFFSLRLFDMRTGHVDTCRAVGRAKDNSKITITIITTTSSPTETIFQCSLFPFFFNERSAIKTQSKWKQQVAKAGENSQEMSTETRNKQTK